MKRIFVVLILVLAFFGLANSTYLTQHELNGTPLLCNIQNLSGCNAVTASQYSRIFGIPIAGFGILFYGIIFVLSALEIVIFNQLLRRVLQAISFIGVLSALYFTSVQLFVIGAFCIYCFASTLAALFIFVLATLIEPIKILRRNVRQDKPSQNTPYLPMPPGS